MNKLYRHFIFYFHVISLIDCNTQDRTETYYFNDYWCKQVHDMNTQHSQNLLRRVIQGTCFLCLLLDRKSSYGRWWTGFL